MGKRKKRVHAFEKTIEEPKKELLLDQIYVGLQINRWAAVRESMHLSDEKLMKAMLDLLEDRRVCPHGCYMKNTPSSSITTRIQPKLVRTVGTQTKCKNSKKNSDTQTYLTLKDLESVKGTSDQMINTEADITVNQTEVQNVNLTGNLPDLPTFTSEDIRWKALKTSHGLKTDDQLLNILIDWYMNTQPVMQLTKDIPTTTDMSQNSKESTVEQPSSYFLTLSVTPDQEQAIKNLCLLREWPYTKYSHLMEQTESVLRREHKTAPVTFFKESTAAQETLLKSQASMSLTEPIMSVGDLASESSKSDTLSAELKGDSIVDLVTRSRETSVVSSDSMFVETNTADLVAGSVENTLMNAARVVEPVSQDGQNVYIPVPHNEFREGDIIYKQVNQSQDDHQRRDNDSIYKPLENQLTQQRLPQMPYVLPNTVPMQSMGIFPKTTSSFIDSSGAFTTSQVDYESYRRKLDESDTVQNQKYKKIRLTPQNRPVSFPASGEQEPFHSPTTEEQYSQIHNGIGYGYLQTSYSHGQ